MKHPQRGNLITQWYRLELYESILEGLCILPALVINAHRLFPSEDSKIDWRIIGLYAGFFAFCGFAPRPILVTLLTAACRVGGAVLMLAIFARLPRPAPAGVNYFLLLPCLLGYLEIYRRKSFLRVEAARLDWLEKLTRR